MANGFSLYPVLISRKKSCELISAETEVNEMKNTLRARMTLHFSREIEVVKNLIIIVSWYP